MKTFQVKGTLMGLMIVNVILRISGICKKKIGNANFTLPPDPAMVEVKLNTLMQLEQEINL